MAIKALWNARGRVHFALYYPAIIGRSTGTTMVKIAPEKNARAVAALLVAPSIVAMQTSMEAA